MTKQAGSEAIDAALDTSAGFAQAVVTLVALDVVNVGCALDALRSLCERSNRHLSDRQSIVTRNPSIAVALHQLLALRWRVRFV